MKTKEIDGVLYELVPEEKEGSCKGCAFKDPDRTICTILTKNCTCKGLIYKKVDEPISTSNLKPFNLEAAKAGKPVCTRDGCKARIICFDSTLKNYPLVVLVDRKAGEYPYTYTAEGKFDEDGKNSDFDLMMLPEKKEGWVNVYHDIDASSYRSCGFIYTTKEQAVKEARSTYITTVKIEWEE